MVVALIVGVIADCSVWDMVTLKQYNEPRKSDSKKVEFKIQLTYEKTLYRHFQSPSCSGASEGRKDHSPNCIRDRRSSNAA